MFTLLCLCTLESEQAIAVKEMCCIAKSGFKMMACTVIPVWHLKGGKSGSQKPVSHCNRSNSHCNRSDRRPSLDPDPDWDYLFTKFYKESVSKSIKHTNISYTTTWVLLATTLLPSSSRTHTHTHTHTRTQSHTHTHTHTHAVYVFCFCLFVCLKTGRTKSLSVRLTDCWFYYRIWWSLPPNYRKYRLTRTLHVYGSMAALKTAMIHQVGDSRVVD